MNNFKKVIDLCEKDYPEGNERTAGSAHFSLGCLLLEMGQREQSKPHLQASLKISKKALIQKLIAKGCETFKLENADAVEVDQLCAPSIFDDEPILGLKQVLTEIAEFIKECESADAAKFEQLKAEAEKRKADGTFGKEMDAPTGFGEKPQDAENFQPVTIKVKSKKRTLDEAKDSWQEPDS